MRKRLDEETTNQIRNLWSEKTVWRHEKSKTTPDKNIYAIAGRKFLKMLSDKKANALRRRTT